MNRSTLSSSSIRYSGYLFKRSNKPYVESKENLTDLVDITAPTSEQSYNEIDATNPNHIDEAKEISSQPLETEQTLPLPIIPRVASSSEPVIMPLLPSLSRNDKVTTGPFEEEKTEEQNKDGVENASHLLASFFGMSHCCCVGGKERTKESILTTPLLEKRDSRRADDSSQDNDIPPVTVPMPPPFLGPEPSRSLPISINGSSSQSMSNDLFDTKQQRMPLHESLGEPYHTKSYADIHHNYEDIMVDESSSSNQQSPPPQSYIDPNDGHIWRAKYCVLVDGVLYFYRNAQIGNSREAEMERDRILSNNPKHEPDTVAKEVDYLGKSPMPRNLHPMLSAKEKNGGGSFCLDPAVYWEKRVALNMVGAVRSSPDFGECAFELIALSSGDNINDEEDLDRLVMRASTADEMNSWIFEIHKSFVILMKQLAAVVGSNDSRGSQFVRHKSNTYGAKALCSPPLPIMSRGRSTSSRATTSSFIAPNSPMIHNIFGGLSTNSPEVLVPSILQVKGSKTARRRSFGHNSDLDINALDSPGIMPQIMIPRSTSDEFIDTLDLRPSRFQKLKITSSRSSTRLDKEAEEAEKAEEASLSIGRNGSYESITPSESAEETKPQIEPKVKAYIPPHLREEKPVQKYIPPHLRKKMELEKLQMTAQNIDIGNFDNRHVVLETPIDLIEQVKAENEEFESIFSESQRSSIAEDASVSSSSMLHDANENKFIKLGGCADPFLVDESICHEKFIPHSSSKVTLDHDAYGHINEMSEIGAVSRIGIRDYNEDAFLILNDVLKTEPNEDMEDFDLSDSFFNQFEQRCLFAIFDGHCGNQAARYAAEKFQSILLEESLVDEDTDITNHQDVLSRILHGAVATLDDEFCTFCSEGGRDWYSGSTAIIALILDDHIAVASVGDASGVFSASTKNIDRAMMNDWTVLTQEESELDDELNKIGGSTKGIIYKEVNESHCPSRPEEKERIHAANGWVTHETDIPIITQFQRMDWGDRDVLDIFLRCFSDRLNTPARILNIYRVCGDLAVSRAIGDKEYKAAFNRDADGLLGDNEWRSPAPMPYNTYKDIHDEEHSGLFEGDLVISTPGVRFFELGSFGTDEFLLIACDGLWDVIDPDDAVRVTRNLLFGVEISARECAERLAQIAKGLGSSDNITVIVVKFFGK